ncbi:MAG: PQQ-binding-like beta-propeller repeat protein [Candidatus Bathyarchaeia archaeon]|jgi:outer membrane protein assembly factor BamB
MKKRALSLFLVILLVASAFLFFQVSTVEAFDSEEWPMFHGDEGHTGYSPVAAGPLTAPSHDTWNYTIDSQVNWCQPTIVNGVLYAGGYYGNIYALYAVTGESLWTYNPNTNYEIRGSPVVHNGVVYVGSNGGLFYALNASDGNRLWMYTQSDGNSFVASPTIADGKLYACDDGGIVYCFDPSSEGPVWESHVATDAIYSSPAVVNGVVYVGSYDHNVYALDASTGDPVWATPFSTGDAIYSSPAVADGIVYIGSQDHNLYALNAVTGEEIWFYPTGGAVQSTPALAGGLVYFASDDGKVYACNTQTHALEWTFTAVPNGSSNTGIWASPIVAGNTLYIGTMENRFYAIDATSGSEQWVSYLSDPVYGSAAVAYGMVYYISGGEIAAFGSPAVPPTAFITPYVWKMDINQSKTFTANPLGGSGNYTGYQWYVDGLLQTGETLSTYIFTPQVTGSHLITVTVTDDTNTTSAPSNAATISVDLDPTISIAPSITNLEAGQTQTFTALAIDGTAPLTYTWYINDTAVPNSNRAAYSYTPASSGSVTIHCTVTDSASEPVTAQSNTIQITIAVGPSVSITPTSWEMNVWQTKVFTANAVGGSGSYSSYQWYVDGSVQNGQTASTFSYTPSVAGQPTITVKVTDSIGVTSPLSNSASVSVNEPLLPLTPTSSSSSVTQGQTTTLTASVDTGTAPYTYQWFSKAPDKAAYSIIDGATSNSYNFVTSAETVAGTWHFMVQVTDGTGEVINSTAAKIVVAALLTPSASPTPTSPSASNPTPTPSSISTVTPTPDASNVNSSSPTPTGTTEPPITIQESGSPIWNNADLSVIIAAAVIVAVISLLLVRFKRNKVPPISNGPPATNVPN